MKKAVFLALISGAASFFGVLADMVLSALNGDPGSWDGQGITAELFSKSLRKEGVKSFRQWRDESSLAGRYLGMYVDEDGLVACARFRNTGSSFGSQILGLYQAITEEAGLKMKGSSSDEYSRMGCSFARRSAKAFSRDLKKIRDGGLPQNTWAIISFNDMPRELILLKNGAGEDHPRRISAGELSQTADRTLSPAS